MAVEDRLKKRQLLQEDIVDSIIAERHRQESLKATGKFRYTCADAEMPSDVKGCVLVEECGEVARAVLNLQGYATDYREGRDNEGRDNLRKELVQVAAVCIAWLECIDGT